MKCEQALIHFRVLFAWATKFNRKYVGPIHDTKLGGVVCILAFFWGGGRWTPLDRAGQTRFSRSARSARKASEICLRASEKTVGESLTGLAVVFYVIIM